MMSSRSKPKSDFFFYDVTAGEVPREVHLPSIADHRLIGSSQGFIFSLDREGEIHATSPFTGANLSLPSSSFLPNITGVKKKKNNNNTVINHYNIKGYGSSMTARMLQSCYIYIAIASPNLDAAVVIEEPINRRLAFANRSNNDNECSSPWTALKSGRVSGFMDMIFHKGRLHAVNNAGFLVVFDLKDPTDLPVLHRKNPLMNIHNFEVYLVESPDGEDLYLVQW